MEKTKTESIRERIKTFEDAVEATGMTLPFSEEQMAVLPKDVVAYMKLRIIAAALNGLTKDTINEFPRFCEGEYRYYPIFRIYDEEQIIKTGGKNQRVMFAEFACSSSIYAWGGTGSFSSARLAVKTREDALYFGKQFASIWYDYIGA